MYEKKIFFYNPSKLKLTLCKLEGGRILNQGATADIVKPIGVHTWFWKLVHVKRHIYVCVNVCLFVFWYISCQVSMHACMHANEGVVERAASKAMLKGEHEHKCLVACNRTRSLARSLSISFEFTSLTLHFFFLYLINVVNDLFSHSIKSLFDSKGRYSVTDTHYFYDLHSTFFLMPPDRIPSVRFAPFLLYCWRFVVLTDTLIIF